MQMVSTEGDSQKELLAQMKERGSLNAETFGWHDQQQWKRLHKETHPAVAFHKCQRQRKAAPFMRFLPASIL